MSSLFPGNALGEWEEKMKKGEKINVATICLSHNYQNPVNTDIMTAGFEILEGFHMALISNQQITFD